MYQFNSAVVSFPHSTANTERTSERIPKWAATSLCVNKYAQTHHITTSQHRTSIPQHHCTSTPNHHTHTSTPKNKYIHIRAVSRSASRNPHTTRTPNHLHTSTNTLTARDGRGKVWPMYDVYSDSSICGMGVCVCVCLVFVFVFRIVFAVGLDFFRSVVAL